MNLHTRHGVRWRDGSHLGRRSWNNVRRVLVAFGHDRRGVVALVFGLLVVPLLALAGMAVDLGLVLSEQAKMSGAADSAALAAASVAGDADEAVSRALSITELNLPAADNGDVLVAGDVEVGNWDIEARVFSSGATPVNAARVTVRRTETNGNPLELTFGGIIGFDKFDLEASAVAASSGSGGTACVLALDTTASKAVEVSGGAAVSLTDCDVAANSVDDDALSITGNASLKANCVSLVGNTSADSPELDLTCGAAAVEGPVVDDPYTDLPAPTPDANCVDPDFSVDPAVISPGTYCDFRINAGKTVELQSGTYYIDDGNFTVNGSATLREVAGGTGVTIILTDSSGDSPGSLTINGGAVVTLAAPTSGDYSGVVFYQDKEAISTTKNKFNGGSTTNLTGAIYFPKEAIEFTGGNVSGGADCTQIIAQTIKFGGNSVVNSTCENAGTETIIIPIATRLVQ